MPTRCGRTGLGAWDLAPTVPPPRPSPLLADQVVDRPLAAPRTRSSSAGRSDTWGGLAGRRLRRAERRRPPPLSSPACVGEGSHTASWPVRQVPEGTKPLPGGHAGVKLTGEPPARRGDVRPGAGPPVPPTGGRRAVSPAYRFKRLVASRSPSASFSSRSNVSQQTSAVVFRCGVAPGVVCVAQCRPSESRTQRPSRIAFSSSLG